MRHSFLGIASMAVMAALLLTSSAMSVSASTQLGFGTPLNLSNTSGASTGPAVATVGPHVYVAWEDQGSGSKVTTYFRMSSDNGITFNPVIQFTTGLSGAANKQLDAVQIAASGQYVYLTW